MGGNGFRNDLILPCLVGTVQLVRSAVNWLVCNWLNKTVQPLQTAPPLLPLHVGVLVYGLILMDIYMCYLKILNSKFPVIDL